jgi:succinoglycan biosynthesis transport protein ExoP
MDLRDYLHLVRRRWRLIAVFPVLAVVAAAAVTLTATPVYQAQSMLFVSASWNSPNGGDIGTAFEGGDFTQVRVKSYVKVVSTPQVTEPVIRQLGLPLSSQELAEKITVTNPLDTVLLQVDVRDTDPAMARDIANALAAQFTDVLRILETPDGGDYALVRARVIEEADLPTTPVSPRPLPNLAIGLLVGLALGVAAGWARESLDMEGSAGTSRGRRVLTMSP